MNRVQGPAMELNQGQRQETSHLQHRSDVHPGDRHTYTTAQASGQKWRRAPWGRGRGFQVRLIKATKANWCSQNPDTSHNEAIVICITSPSLLQPYYKKKKISLRVIPLPAVSKTFCISLTVESLIWCYISSFSLENLLKDYYLF